MGLMDIFMPKVPGGNGSGNGSGNGGPPGRKEPVGNGAKQADGQSRPVGFQTPRRAAQNSGNPNGSGLTPKGPVSGQPNGAVAQSATQAQRKMPFPSSPHSDLAAQQLIEAEAERALDEAHRSIKGAAFERKAQMDGQSDSTLKIVESSRRDLVRTDGAGIISSMKEVPRYLEFWSGSDASMEYKVPREVEREVLVLKTGAKKAVILLCVGASRETSRVLSHLRSRLIADGVSLDHGELLCEKRVIEDLFEEKKTRTDDRTDANQAASKSKALFERWVEMAVQEKATDIHIQVVNTVAEVKIRVDGELEFLRDEDNGIYAPSLAEGAVAWAYNNMSVKKNNSSSQFSVDENLYTMIEAREILGQRIALRFQSMKGHAGVKIVLRLLYVDIDAPTLSYADLGYSRSQIKQLKDAANTPSGLVLFSGVTGSGKTTTLKTFIETHPDNGIDAFYSLEDPVEYPLRGVHQIPIQRDLLDKQGSANKYGEVIAGLLRADPSAVLMGEIRDPATAVSAQQIVETGHMACATVHAHLISGIVPRLTNDEIGMSRDVLTNPNILTLLAYQALVPKICPRCRINGSQYTDRMDDAEHVLEILDILEQKFRFKREQFFFKRVGGCPDCSNRGTKGLTVVAEILTPDRKWLDLVRNHQDYEALIHYRNLSDGRFDSSDMRGKMVFEHALYKAVTGTVDPRQCERFDSFSRFELSKRTQQVFSGGRIETIGGVH